MVNKNCSILVAGFGKYPFCLAKEAWICQYEVVNGDTIPWLGGNKDSVLTLAFFAPPRDLSHCTKQAACASGSMNIGQSLGDLALLGKLLELFECNVFKTIVPMHQLSLVAWSHNGVFVGLLKGWRKVKDQGSSLQGVWMLSILLRHWVACWDYVAICTHGAYTHQPLEIHVLLCHKLLLGSGSPSSMCHLGTEGRAPSGRRAALRA
jgi:hypothetical protein